MTMIETIKKAAQEANQAAMPVRFMFGVVTSLSMLTIRVENRLDISGDDIVLMREFRGGGYPTHTHTIDPHDHTVPAHNTRPAGEGPHTHGVQPFQTETTGLISNPESYSGLVVGDKLVLLRNQGGQQYLVLGRV